MAAPKQNKFWMNRTSSGPEALFSDPVLLWAEACKYFEWGEKNPLKAVEYNGKDAKKCIVPKMRAYTWDGLCLFLGVNSKYFFDRRDALEKVKGAKKEAAQEMIAMMDRIKQVMYVQKFEGAAAGLLAGNIISRDLGMVDKQQLDANVTSKVDAKVNMKAEVLVRSSGVPLASKEADVQGKR